jgi:hypothetical protein
MTFDGSGNAIDTIASRHGQMLWRGLQQVPAITSDYDYEPVHIVHAVAATFALIFLLFLPLRLWTIRASRANVTPTWQSLSKMVIITSDLPGI